jgi:hypothetical protein
VRKGDGFAVGRRDVLTIITTDHVTRGQARTPYCDAMVGLYINRGHPISATLLEFGVPPSTATSRPDGEELTVPTRSAWAQCCVSVHWARDHHLVCRRFRKSRAVAASFVPAIHRPIEVLSRPCVFLDLRAWRGGCRAGVGSREERNGVDTDARLKKPTVCQIEVDPTSRRLNTTFTVSEISRKLVAGQP